MKTVVYITISVCMLFGCTNYQKPKPKSSRNVSESQQISDTGFVKHRVEINANGDTDNIFVEVAGSKLQIHYYKNKPQFFRYDNDFIVNKDAINEFIRNNKGLYLSLADSDTIASFGLKYFSGSKAIDVGLSPSGMVNYVDNWSNYTNAGYRVNLSQVPNKRIILYRYNENDKLDSIVYVPVR